MGLMRDSFRIDFSRLDLVKNNTKALAILLDINFHEKREASRIINDLNLDLGEGEKLLSALDRERYIEPNPHRKVKDINYILAEKGRFLINELKAGNPELFAELDAAKHPKLSKFIGSQSPEFEPS